MKQLSGLDAAFLFAETANAPMHIGGLSLWDPSTAPGGVVNLERIIQTAVERAHLAPHTRQRLYQVPFSADFPYWLRDESFDPDYHIRHIALPPPGNWRQLCVQVARLNESPLDRSWPLWETYVIEGLDGFEGIPPGCYACFSKTHHAAIDGRSSSDIGTAMCDPTPEIREIPGAEDWRPDQPPRPWEMALRAQQHNALKPLHYLELMQKALPAAARTMAAIASGRIHGDPKVPRTRFNASVSPQRIFEGVTYSLDEIKAVKNSASCTVNDVMLAIISGAMRRYLLEKQELPDISLVAQCPVNLRPRDEHQATGGNQVASMAVALCTDVADPKQRLRAVADESRNAKALANAMDATVMVEMQDFTLTTVAAEAARIAAEQGWANFLSPTYNTVATNIPGPQSPVYSNGARYIRGWGTGPCIDGNGLFQSIGSYCGEVTIGISSCRKMMPDPEIYAQCLRESFEELSSASLGKGSTSGRRRGQKATPGKAIGKKSSTPGVAKSRPKPKPKPKPKAKSKTRSKPKTRSTNSAPRKRGSLR